MYKQGLIVNADVEEEIELHENSLVEAEASPSALDAVVAPISNELEPSAVKPPLRSILQKAKRRKNNLFFDVVMMFFYIEL